MDKAITEIVNLPVSGTQLVNVNAKRAACNHRVMDARGRLLSTKEAKELPRATLASWVLSKPPKCIHNSMVAQLQLLPFLL